METLKERAVSLAADVADIGTAALSALWPRSMASREMERLAEQGYIIGAEYEVDFILSFDETTADEALAAVRNAGFVVTERTRSTFCYATARRRIPLRAYHLDRATSLLQRVVAPYYGYASPLGPVARVYEAPREAAHRHAPSSAA